VFLEVEDARGNLEWQPNRAGNSHASAFTSATTGGGKSRGTTSAGTLLQTRQAFSEEALPPFAHDRPRHIEPLAELLVLKAIGRQEDDPGPDHVSIR